MEKLLESLTYFGLFQGLFLLGIFLFAPRFRKNINGYLVFLISVLIIGLLGRTLFLLEIFGQEPRLITISEASMLLFGPSFALFIKSSLKDRRFQYRDLIHFIPAVIHIIYMVKTFILVSNEVLIARFYNGEIVPIVLSVAAAGLIVNFGYWIWGWVMFIQFKRSMKDEISYSVKSRFLFLFLVGIGLCLTLWLTVFLVTLMNYEFLSLFFYRIVWLSFTLVVLLLGFYLLTNPELLSLNFKPSKTKYHLSKLKASDITRLKAELEAVMLDKKPYLNKKLLKAELSDLLGISGPEMARLLNEGFGMSFFEFVNYYRIKEFIALAESNSMKNLTFAAIAEEAGFNSKATFNKSFKEIMGKTPREHFGSIQ